MGIIEFRPYIKLSNDKLLEEVYKEMKKTKDIYKNLDEELYLKETTKLNDMIIEVKKRNIKLDNKTLIKRILTN